MSKNPFDSFLPSGAVDSPRTFPNSSLMVGNQVPRTVPDLHLSHASSATHSPNAFLQTRSPSKHQNGPPISPPRTRSGSAEESSAALVENWRGYTDRLRSQCEGERRHMAADRERMEEVMAEERALWAEERAIMKSRIEQLEAQLEVTRKGTLPSVPRANKRPSLTKRSTSSGSNSGSSPGSHGRQVVPQESGRDADGTPFYAPAPQNPSRTFDNFETASLRVGSISTQGENVIRVTSKELTASDFGVHSEHHHDLQTILESPTKSIDISQIQPTLEGVAIKASAVSPTFVAKVLSPQKSPQRLSPDKRPSPPREFASLSPSLGGSRLEVRAQKTLEVATQPEKRRLTMHAGHTPNHSITNFSTLLPTDTESGNATPTQAHPNAAEHEHHHPAFVVGIPEDGSIDELGDQTGDDQGDRELSGQLGFTNESDEDDPFFRALVEKLEEARRSSENSPTMEQIKEIPLTARLLEDEDDDDDEKDEGPKLKLRQSTNFGKPLGQL